MIIVTLGPPINVRHSIVEDPKYLIGVFQEPATPLPAREHHDPPDTPPPVSLRPEFATPQKPAPPNHHQRLSSSSSSSSTSSLMKPPSHAAPHAPNQRPVPNRPNGLHKAPGPGPGGGGGGYHGGGGGGGSSSSSSSSAASSSSSSQRPRPPISSNNNNVRPHPPKINFNPPPPSSSLSSSSSSNANLMVESPDVNDILKEMKLVASPLTAIAATPRKEIEHPRFDFGLSNHSASKRGCDLGGIRLMDDLNVSSDSDSDVDLSAPPPASLNGVLNGLPDTALMSVPSPLEPLMSPPPPSAAVDGASSSSDEGEESEDESSSGSGSGSESSSEENSEPEVKARTPNQSTPPKVNSRSG